MRSTKLLSLLLALPIVAFAQSSAIECVVLSVTNKEVPRQYSNENYVGSLFGNIPTSIAFAAAIGSQGGYIIPTFEQNMVIRLRDNTKFLVMQIAAEPNLMYRNQNCYFARDANGIKVIPQ